MCIPQLLQGTKSFHSASGPSRECHYYDMVEARLVRPNILVFAFAGEKHAPNGQFFCKDLRMEPTEAYVGTAAEVLVGLLGAPISLEEHKARQEAARKKAAEEEAARRQTDREQAARQEAHKQEAARRKAQELAEQAASKQATMQAHFQAQMQALPPDVQVQIQQELLQVGG